jgi:hypothetical protein
MHVQLRKHIRLPMFLALFWALILMSKTQAQPPPSRPDNSFRPAVPRMWDDQAMSTLEVASPVPGGSAKHASADYYYSIPVRPIYKSYPVYAPGYEPAGYMDRLNQLEPEIIWDTAHLPPLQTEADWIKAGETVFDAPSVFDFPETPAEVRAPAWYKTAGVPVTKEGIMPFDRYVIRKKGKVELTGLSCATCHIRLMPDGSILKGAQGNFPVDRISAYRFRDALRSLEVLRKPSASRVPTNASFSLHPGFSRIRLLTLMCCLWKQSPLATTRFLRA